jgi:DNA primase
VFEHGPEAFLDASSRAPGIITFLMNCAVDKHGLSTEGKIRIISELQEPLAAINDRVAQALYIRQLSERIGIAEAAVLERIKEISTQKTRTPSMGSGPALPVHGSRKNGIPESIPGNGELTGANVGSRFERQIIAMMLQFPEVLPDVKKPDTLKYFENNALKHIGELILKFNATSAEQVSELISQAESQEIQKLIASLAMGDESWNMKGCLKLLGKFVESGRKRDDSGRLKEQIKAAEKSNDHALLLKLLNQKQKMAERNEKRKMAILT